MSPRTHAEREQAEAALQAAAERYRTVLALISDYAYAYRVDPDQQFVLEWVTGAFTRITGYTPEEMMAQGGPPTIVHPDDLPITQRRQETILAGQPDIRDEYRIRTKDGEVRWLEDHGRAVWDAGQGRVVGMVGAARDITERKRAEDERVRLIADLRASLQASDEMIANVSHELRTPLAVILGYSDLLRAGILGGNLSPDELHAMESIYDQAQRLARLVDALLTLQTLGAQQLAWQEVKVADLVTTTVSRWQHLAQMKRMALAVQVAADMPVVAGDWDYLRQALDQLLDNACKFTPEGGSVTVRVERRGSEVWLSVADTGVGLAPDELERVFERFYQVDASSTRRYGGAGIGLSLAQQIVTLHHGRIWAESEGEGKGATFRMALPMTRVSEA